MIHVFCGHDSRESIGWHVFVASMLDRASQPVAVHRLDACGLPQGSNAFTLSRFLVPWLMGYQGRAIFADAADMLMLADVAGLHGLGNDRYAVQVVQHDYRTRHPRKYVGTAMECDNPDYPRKNWASLMLMNCDHPMWRRLDPASVERADRTALLQLGMGLNDSFIGSLPACWNVLADEGQPIEGAKLLHWTAGTPAFHHYHNAPGAELWRAELAKMMEHA